MAAPAAPGVALPQPPPRPANLGVRRPPVTADELAQMHAGVLPIQNIAQFYNFCTQTLQFHALPAEIAALAQYQPNNGRTAYFTRMCGTLLPHIAETQHVVAWRCRQSESLPCGTILQNRTA